MQCDVAGLGEEIVPMYIGCGKFKVEAKSASQANLSVYTFVFWEEKKMKTKKNHVGPQLRQEVVCARVCPRDR